jgi:hypothetical protein
MHLATVIFALTYVLVSLGENSRESWIARRRLCWARADGDDRFAHARGGAASSVGQMRREYAWFSKYVLGVDVPEPKPEKDTEKRPDEKPAN